MDLCEILNHESVLPSSKDKPLPIPNDFSVVPLHAQNERLVFEPASAQVPNSARRNSNPTPDVMDVQGVPDSGDLHLHISSEKRAFEPVGPQVVDTVDIAQTSEASGSSSNLKVS
ncbi:hypothetical protein NW762_012841 [Fusarium torreyae]|uniref:Uncharacterized protein n=1 Tax=Fusarium torreyae TaxID=1237075 RepID=A0A9W8RLL3_9HYPO|nr:hypothetical protein NW762_012841 [Fusarium torreyae]